MSRLKSSDPSSEPHRPPKADLYTVLLVIALLALVVAIIYLWVEMASYDYKLKGGPTALVVERSAVAARQPLAASRGRAAGVTSRAGVSTIATLLDKPAVAPTLESRIPMFRADTARL